DELRGDSALGDHARTVRAARVRQRHPDPRVRRRIAERLVRTRLMIDAVEIQIEPLRPELVTAAALMMAHAFVTNPLHIAAFGPSRIDRNEAFFRAGLAMMKGPTFVATDGRTVLGLVHWVRAPQCQFSRLEKFQVMPVMIGAFGVRSAL